MPWRFILPLPPSVNHQYTERDGRWVLSREARHYKAHLQKAFKRLKAEGKLRWSGEALTSDLQGLLPQLFDEETHISSPAPVYYLRLRLEFFFKTPQRRDLDNGLKIVQDLVCNALGADDRNVVAVELVKRVDAQNPRLEVTVSPLSEWDFNTPSQAVSLVPSSPIDLRPFVPPLPPAKPSQTKTKFNLTEWLAERETE